MIEIEQEVAGRKARIRVVEDQEDVSAFYQWLESSGEGVFAADTETTGLDIFSSEFRVRTVQIGRGLEAWVLPIEEVEVDLGFLTTLDLVFHNAAYDYLAIRQGLGIKLDWERITDTRILAHLFDSRPAREGGIGHSLQELTAAFLDAEVAENVKGSMMQMRNETKLTKNEIFAKIDLWHPTYLLYAGMDVVLTYALRNILNIRLAELERRIPEFQRETLIKFEHKVAEICAELEFNGFLLDLDYSNKLSAELEEEQDVWEAVALSEFGTESVNANAQVAADLIESGVRLNELTDSGNYKLDKSVLEPLAKEGHLLAVAVTEAKKAKKWRTSWVDKFIALADDNARAHASINPLAARTARMSITGIPAQTLPATDWTIRRCFIADPGHTIVSCDYQAQELRVLAAISRDKNMSQAFAEGADLHALTASASGVERSVGKTVNFAYVYGSGAGNIAETCGISVPKAREVIKGFETMYPGVKRLSDRLQHLAKTKGYIVTKTGRVLWTDKERPYAALNYMVQSTSRDITAAALVRLDAAGFTPYLRLPIHDEILACLPEEHAETGANRIAEIMAQYLDGVHIAADADVFGPDWGAGYVSDDEREAYEATL